MSVLLDELRIAVDESGESLNEIGRGSGVTVSGLSRFMSGQQVLTVDVAERLAAYLGVTITVKRPKRKRG